MRGVPGTGSNQSASPAKSRSARASSKVRGFFESIEMASDESFPSIRDCVNDVRTSQIPSNIHKIALFL
jgi:hypothetical protein